MEITKSASMEHVRNVVMNHIVIGMKNVTIIDVLLSGDQAMMDIEIQAVTLDSYVLLEDFEVQVVGLDQEDIEVQVVELEQEDIEA